MRPVRSRLGTSWAGSVAAIALAAIFGLAACTTGSTASMTPAPATVGPNISTPPTAVPDGPTAAPISSIPAGPPSVPGPPAGSPPVGGPPLDTMFDAHDAPDLEARLPADASAIPLARFSLTGEDVLDGADRAPFDALLGALGKDPGDLSLAVAIDPTGRLGATVTAFRVASVDAGALLIALNSVSAGSGGAPLPVPASATVAGKQVVPVTLGPSMPAELRALEAHYLYASGDVVYLVHGSTAGAAAVIGVLP